ncbi:hypothetical protein RHMOL_Rhmol01G0225900 [Rhododendron molle]|uniref:Uncharacterized protein n=1 Tax=Rhododendron molle TaxID=49168 RepID=A0ACC0Q3Y5_RHOML|nr:hypothetical protein RHMOL_Rhmol01G0225900 [Rhododendron molle]
MSSFRAKQPIKSQTTFSDKIKNIVRSENLSINPKVLIDCSQTCSSTVKMGLGPAFNGDFLEQLYPFYPLAEEALPFDFITADWTNVIDTVPYRPVRYHFYTKSKHLKGGGITRLKQHLAGVKGEVEACKNVPMDVKWQMNQTLEGYKQEKERRERISRAVGEGASYQALEEEEEESLLDKGTSGDTSGTKKKRSKTIGGYFAPRTTPGAQPSIKSALSSKQTIDEARMTVARWWYDANIPFKATLSLYYQPVTRYIYNHAWVLNTMRKDFTNGRDFCRPSITRFATNFLSLQCLLNFKKEHRQMFTSDKWLGSRYAKCNVGKEVAKILLEDREFWSNCQLVVKVSELLVRVLRLTDGDEKPVMGYLYEAMDEAKEAIKVSATGCERNWSTFEFIHSKKRNRLEHKRLNDLVYVRYNLKLRERIIKQTRDALDLISLENIDVLDDWVSEEPSLLDEEDIAWEIVEPPSLEALTLYEDIQEPNFDDAADDFPNENESQFDYWDIGGHDDPYVYVE